MKTIPGYENLYSITTNGKVWSHKKDKFVNQVNHNKGYKVVRLYIGAKEKSYLVHRLVAMTYLKPDSTRPWVNHKDCNKRNNHVSNLEWCTRRENMLHAVDNGLMFGKSHNHPSSKMTEEKVRRMRQLHSEQSISYPRLAEMFGVSLGLAWGIVNHTRWKYVT